MVNNAYLNNVTIIIAGLEGLVTLTLEISYTMAVGPITRRKQPQEVACGANQAIRMYEYYV